MKLNSLMAVVIALSMSFAAKGEEKAVKVLDVTVPVWGASGAKAKYVLVSFWSNEVKFSKAEVATLEKELKASKSSKIAFVAVAFEPLRLSYERYGEDNDGVFSDVYRTYKLRNSLSNYLVNADGFVVARDVTPEVLAYYINENN